MANNTGDEVVCISSPSDYGEKRDVRHKIRKAKNCILLIFLQSEVEAIENELIEHAMELSKSEMQGNMHSHTMHDNAYRFCLFQYQE